MVFIFAHKYYYGSNNVPIPDTIGKQHLLTVGIPIIGVPIYVYWYTYMYW